MKPEQLVRDDSNKSCSIPGGSRCTLWTLSITTTTWRHTVATMPLRRRSGDIKVSHCLKYTCSTAWHILRTVQPELLLFSLLTFIAAACNPENRDRVSQSHNMRSDISVAMICITTLISLRNGDLRLRASAGDKTRSQRHRRDLGKWIPIAWRQDRRRVQGQLQRLSTRQGAIWDIKQLALGENHRRGERLRRTQGALAMILVRHTSPEADNIEV